jgi:toxin-antitoxin system PIN domain toxin
MSSPSNPGFPPPLATVAVAQEAPGLPWGLPGNYPSSYPGNTPVGDLLDINVWLALAVQEHPHHTVAHQYWGEVQTQHAATRSPFVWFCRVTMLGMVRLLCQPKAVGPGALSLSAAWALHQQYRALPQIGLLAEPAGCEAPLQRWVSPADGNELPARLWTDAYLAAVAQSAGLRLVSFDRDFQRFTPSRCLILPTQ